MDAESEARKILLDRALVWMDRAKELEAENAALREQLKAMDAKVREASKMAAEILTDKATLMRKVEELEANLRDYENYVWPTAELRALRDEGIS